MINFYGCISQDLDSHSTVPLYSGDIDVGKNFLIEDGKKD